MEKNVYATKQSTFELPSPVAAMIQEIGQRANLQVGTIVETIRREHDIPAGWTLSEDGRALVAPKQATP